MIGPLVLSCDVLHRALAVNPLGPVGCELGFQWLGLVPGWSMDVQSDLDLENLEARSTPLALCSVLGHS